MPKRKRRALGDLWKLALSSYIKVKKDKMVWSRRMNEERLFRWERLFRELCLARMQKIVLVEDRRIQWKKISECLASVLWMIPSNGLWSWCRLRTALVYSTEEEINRFVLLITEWLVFYFSITQSLLFRVCDRYIIRTVCVTCCSVDWTYKCGVSCYSIICLLVTSGGVVVCGQGVLVEITLKFITRCLPSFSFLFVT